MKRFLHGARPVLNISLSVYRRIERFVPALSFVAGFSWDTLTLSRIDRWIDNITLLAYLLLLTATISLFHLVEHRIVRHPALQKRKEWIPIAIQFLLGGLFSAYVVFYLQSASFTKTLVFVVLLLGLLIANEFVKDRLTNLYLQTALLFLAAFSFFIFFLPVVFKVMNVWMFIAGGLLSLLLVLGLLYFLFRWSAIDTLTRFRRLIGLVGGLYLLMNGLYALNWIPPIPLSVRTAGVYHHVSRNGDDYVVRYQRPPWYAFYQNGDDHFLKAPSDSVFCFASVFAPTELKTRILHRWQVYRPARDEWETTDRIAYRITGGRDGGYRGYTFKTNLTDGEWRVDIETADGALLSRVDFTVKAIPEPNYRLITRRR